MAKKKTSVVLPGGIAGLVHQVQRGGGEPARSDNNAAESAPQGGSQQAPAAADDALEASPATNREQSAVAAEPQEGVSATKKEHSEPAATVQGGGEAAPKRRRGRPAAPKQDVTATEKAEREYHIVKDSGADSWELFLSLGRIYKTRDERLATIYIDPDLKRILDRLKTASGVKLPTAAILSSIVARFIFDHEKKINDVIFGERLI